MSESPHLDGLVMIVPGDLVTNSANLLVMRNGKGDWSLNRTAVGVENYFVRAMPSQSALARNGENYFLEDFPNTGGFAPAAPAKGFQVTDLFANVGFQTALPTTLTLRLSKIQYPLSTAAAAAPVVTDILAATSVIPAGLQTLGQYLTVLVPVASPVFTQNDLSLLEIELAITTAGTTVLQIANVGCHVNFNYT